RGQWLQDVAGAWSPDAKTRLFGGHVVDHDRSILRLMLAHPAEVVVAEGGPGHDEEPVGLEPGYREVAFDAAPAVEHLGVGDAAERAVHLVVAQALEKGERARAADRDLAEGGFVEEAGAFSRGAVFGGDRR